MEQREHPEKHKKSSTEEFEEALNQKDNRKYHLRLFVTGVTPRSLEAIENVRHLCEENLRGRYELEVIDLYKEPEAAGENQVVAAPTLIKLLPNPVRKFIGNITEEKLLTGLEIRVQPVKE
jgi:circadian clock protein KaiB